MFFSCYFIIVDYDMDSMGFTVVFAAVGAVVVAIHGPDSHGGTICHHKTTTTLLSSSFVKGLG